MNPGFPDLGHDILDLIEALSVEGAPIGPLRPASSQIAGLWVGPVPDRDTVFPSQRTLVSPRRNQREFVEDALTWTFFVVTRESIGQTIPALGAEDGVGPGSGPVGFECAVIQHVLEEVEILAHCGRILKVVGGSGASPSAARRVPGGFQLQGKWPSDRPLRQRSRMVGRMSRGFNSRNALPCRFAALRTVAKNSEALTWHRRTPREQSSRTQQPESRAGKPAVGQQRFGSLGFPARQGWGSRMRTSKRGLGGGEPLKMRPPGSAHDGRKPRRDSGIAREVPSGLGQRMGGNIQIGHRAGTAPRSIQTEASVKLNTLRTSRALGFRSRRWRLSVDREKSGLLPADHFRLKGESVLQKRDSILPSRRPGIGAIPESGGFRCSLRVPAEAEHQAVGGQSVAQQVEEGFQPGEPGGRGP